MMSFVLFPQVFSKFGNAEPELARFSPLAFILPLHALDGGVFIALKIPCIFTLLQG